MHIQILGSAAGGGFPQWNCNCRNCAGVRSGKVRAQPRSQSSIALSANGVDWVLCNASPDIRAQLDAFPPLQPARRVRDTGIAAIILMDSQIDHVTGLLSLREGCPHPVWCTDMVHQDLTSGFPLFNMLQHWNGGLAWHPIDLASPVFEIPACTGLKFTAIPLRSSAPPYSPHRGNPHPGDNIGLFIEDLASGGSLFYAPGLGQVDETLLGWMRRADCLLVDGTLWRDDEMRHCEVGDKLGSEMGHLPQSGPGGMIEVLDGISGPRKVLIHINNTNPILDVDSRERAELGRHGIEVAWDGMSIEL
ncbi:pyrroloquinoline quinone biosynthesis protein PqqB [Pseudomonas sp. JS3066]|uniref:pyrroloquinoline quinone biosynthesis protein PqqB n=1 Tax=Pseudomonas sp. JS3066 TaxID=3090665 RepID=UPI002E7BEC2C|nr:pyrroloquinoline quinone biosynthesis protein PqqB [Pseudomonas sp. JS3066]WVK96199.1 pyrroloquinoline quinone biosynthesis protein PqqB [Pseudomonas sp. JS3066]